MDQHRSHRTTAFPGDDQGLVEVFGSGRPILVLHGAAGPSSVSMFAQSLAKDHQVLLPTHPGFAGTRRPPEIATVEDLAAAYLALLVRLNFTEVVLVGFSLGGWVASLMAATCAESRELRGVISSLVLVDAIGLHAPGEPILNVQDVPREDLPRFAYHDPARFHRNADPDAAAASAANFAALEWYAGRRGMCDPGLSTRLGQVKLPVLVAWGASDRVVTPRYGEAYAACFANSSFALIEEAGHLPQVEQPERLLAALRAFLSRNATSAALKMGAS